MRQTGVPISFLGSVPCARCADRIAINALDMREVRERFGDLQTLPMHAVWRAVFDALYKGDALCGRCAGGRPQTFDGGAVHMPGAVLGIHLTLSADNA